VSRETQIAALQSRLYDLMGRRDKISRLYELALDKSWTEAQTLYVGEINTHLESELQKTLDALLILDPS
jgi:hypothetical protein